MIHRGLEFHNVVDLESRDGMAGLQLQRFSRSARVNMSPRGRWNAQSTVGCEIRVATDAPHVRLFVSSMEGDADLAVFRGDCLHAMHYLKPNGVQCIHVSPPVRFAPMKPDAFRGGCFAPNLWRFVLAGYQTLFHQFDAFGYDYRPPEPDAKPTRRWLAYGSSITAGSGATRPYLGYTQLAARHLGVDVLNMGQGGACMCEPEVADFFAERGDWDFATLEIATNMRDTFTPEAFRERAEYLVNRMLDANPGKPLVLITPFANFVDHEASPSPVAGNQTAFEAIMRELAAARAGDGLHLLEGRAILPEFGALNTDLVHPGDYGNILMAHNLAAALRQILPTSWLRPTT